MIRVEGFPPFFDIIVIIYNALSLLFSDIFTLATLGYLETKEVKQLMFTTFKNSFPIPIPLTDE